MRQFIGLLALVLLAGTVAWAGDKKDEKPAGEMTDPLAILKKTDAAMKAVKAVKYDLTIEATGALKERSAKLEGSVIAAERAKPESDNDKSVLPTKFRMETRFTVPNDSEPYHLIGGNDGKDFYLVDFRTKTVYADLDPAVLGSASRVILRGMMIEYLHPRPFDDELGGKQHTLKESKTVDGEDCYAIEVIYNIDQAPTVTWFISKKDFLPRGRIDMLTLQDGQKGEIHKMLSHLVVDPKLSEDAFEIRVPDGFTKTDEFAP
ncbi:MAG: hypothetical protein PVJ57_22290 [Phycisphaerae bacterium]|jgi:hypothetical protein